MAGLLKAVGLRKNSSSSTTSPPSIQPLLDQYLSQYQPLIRKQPHAAKQQQTNDQSINVDKTPVPQTTTQSNDDESDDKEDKSTTKKDISTDTNKAERDKSLIALLDAAKLTKEQQGEKGENAVIDPDVAKIYAEDVIGPIIEGVANLAFEDRKAASLTLTSILTSPVPPLPPSYFSTLLACQSAVPACALPLGALLRATLSLEANNSSLLSSPSFLSVLLPVLTASPNFDVLTDSFETLKLSLTSSPAPRWLEAHYCGFFDAYGALLRNQNYVTRRFGLQLLSSVLLSRSNFGTMMRYISSLPALKSTMELLRDPHSAIQYEAFHVFKVFIVNPRKTDEIVKVLRMNKKKLVEYLQGRWGEREGEGSFREERELVIKTLEEL
mmetsp:Transcript_22545/g.46991  ORF Transcript_22545/g.46991 Transcript_22545/m.46991 type:complete len:383 (+) Transcript_22545:355-1503(+)